MLIVVPMLTSRRQDLGNATVVVNNPPGVVYAGKLPDTANWKAAYPDGGNAKGSIAAVANPDGIGVLFKVTFSNLPKEGGPFSEWKLPVACWPFSPPHLSPPRLTNSLPLEQRTTSTSTPFLPTATAPRLWPT